MLRTDEKVHSKYEIKSKLGNGGMSSVWLAKDTTNDLDVALKVLNSDPLLSAEASKGLSWEQLVAYDRQLKNLFLREGRAMKKLTGHSNIVSVLGVGTSPKEDDNANIIFYIALEYIEGENGSSLISEKVYEKNFAKCLKVALGVCRGLLYAHEKGVIHRDVKPTNILLGKNGAVKIGDFGLAKILSEGAKVFTVPYAGTLPYMAPEQRGTNPVTDERTDVYQFGATLFHIFTGLFADPHGLLMNVQAKEKSNLEPVKINPKIPPKVSDLIMEMLSIDPERRPTLIKIRDTLQKEVYTPEDPRILDRYRMPIINIRRALKEKVETEIDFIKKNTDVIPVKNRKQVWYATFLLRPLLPIENGQSKLADYFTLIYFAEYTGREVTATADWDNNPSLTHKRLPIQDCCSGLPLRWYTEERNGWGELYGDDFYTFHVHGGRLQYLILSDVKKARFDQDTSMNLIRANYATADAVERWKRAVGWDLRDKKTKAPKPMSQDIETEIIVPIYCLASGSNEGLAKQILGVVNFEWDEPIPSERRNDIARQIVEHIQTENIFAITYFTCEVLYNITLPEDNS